MTDTGEKPSDDSASQLAALKTAAKGLEKNVGGLPIEPDVLHEVVAALKNVKDLPEPIIKGLTIVVACNGLNNVSKPSHAGFDVLKLLLAANHAKTVEHFLSAVVKFFPTLPPNRKYALGRHMEFINRWLLSALCEVPKSAALPVPLVVDAIIISSVIIFGRQGKRFPEDLFGVLRRYPAPKLLLELEKRLTDGQDNWRLLITLSVLFNVVNRNCERTPSAEHFQNQPAVPIHQELSDIARLWFKVFVAFISMSPSYPGDQYISFVNGQQLFKHLPADAADSGFRSTLRKTFLKFPETALPALCAILSYGFKINDELSEVLVELIQDSLSSNSDLIHQYTAILLPKILYSANSAKRKLLLEKFLGKQGKVKNRPEYATELQKFSESVYATYGGHDDAWLKLFVTDLEAFSVTEIQAPKSDNVSAPLAQILYGLRHHSQQNSKYFQTALQLLKLNVANFGSTTAYGAAMLASADYSTLEKEVFEGLKDRISTFTNAATSADYVFFVTDLLLKWIGNGGDKAVATQLFKSEAFVKDKFLTQLSTSAYEFLPVFIGDFLAALNRIGDSKLTENSSLVKFAFLSVSGPQLSSTLRHKIAQNFNTVTESTLSSLLLSFASFVNSGESTVLLNKQLDAADPSNLQEAEQYLRNSTFLQTVPDVLKEVVKNSDAVSAEAALSAILLLNNNRARDPKALRKLSSVILETGAGVLQKIVYDTFFSSGVIQKLYDYADLPCRQEAIGWLVSLESKNPQHRDYVWNYCAKLASQISIPALNEVSDDAAAIFFTPEDKLHNVAVIDESSDLNLDGKHNMRRENKAYKFKDQLAEIELRKELAEKNRREGKLTQKQQDAIKKEMLKEKEIRDNLKPVYAVCRKLTDFLLVAIRADPNGALQHYNIFYNIIVPSLKSPLASKAFYDCVKVYCNTFFRTSSDYLGERALSALLRTFKSGISVPEWKWEPYIEQVSKMTSSMNMLCIVNNFLDDNALDALEQLQQEEESDEFNEGLTLGKLAFVLPIIERVFNDPQIDDRVRKEVTNFLKAAFTLDFLTEEEKEWPPLSLLNEILLDAICGNKNGDYFEDIFSLLKRNLAELNRQDPSENVSQYVKKIVEQLHSPNEYVREHISVLLNECPHLLTEALIKTDDYEHLTMIIISSNESVEQIRDISVALCNELNLHLSPLMHDHLIKELKHPYEFWQNGAAAALCGVFRAETVEALERNYDEWLNIVPAVFDNVGRVLAPAKDQWDSRRGVAIAFLKVITTKSYQHEDFDPLMKFLVPKAIGDKNVSVRRTMFAAASELIAQNGSERVDSVLPHLEGLLQNTPDGELGDIVRNGLICLLGTLAQYLDPKSVKLKTIFARLIDTLRTPSRQVQESVALCLPPLAKILHETATEELERLVRAIQRTPSFAERFGYAYGIAGLTKGLGLRSLSMIQFLPTIKEMFESKESNVREAAALLFLTIVHRNTFDPYVAKLLQMLIRALGDTDQTVRDAARDASATMMGSITPSAVKIFLPEILAGLDETNWRAKCASASFLGSISNCAPRQLSECLPRVVPSLANLITDSHAKVQNAGMSAVKQIATVITNPEILAISSHLISAVVEPAKETTRALRVIVNTRFIHFIDPPALAIMMPILQRALSDRDPEGRRMASNVVTNVFSIADEKDVEPYMSMLVPSLKHSLLDPSPEVRSAAAQAIGTVVKHNTDGIFTTYTSDLLPWLKERLMSRTSMVDRMGAAQGLAEVIPSFSKGAERVLKQAIEFTANPENDPAMRDGYIRLFTYLPSTFGDDFIPYIEVVVPAILSALADETEYLRDSALHAGQILIKTYCAQAKRHLLPCLLDGIINEAWRIRHAAVTLIGDFLFSISGISGKMTSDTAAEDDTFGMESANKIILRYVGQKSRDRIIVSLYMARFDAAVQVRQSASHVWKLIVSNTPRTVKEALTPLYELIVHCIATSTEDRRVMGSECLGEVVRKMGERLMDSLMAEVQKAFEDSRADYRRGAIQSLAIIVNNVSTELIEVYTDEINKLFRFCLCDADNDLRQAAGETFAIYHSKIGISAFEDIVDPLFNDYAQRSAEEVLDGIVAILSVNRRGRVITVPSLIPRVLQFKRKAHVLCRLSEVAKDTIERSFIAILDSLLDDRPADADEIYDADCVKLVRCFQSNFVVAGAFKLLAKKAEKGNELAVRMMSELVKNTDNKEDVIAVFIEGILIVYCSEYKPVLIGGVKLFAELVSSCKPSLTMEFPFYLMSGIVGIKAENQKPAALNIPGGWKPIIDLLAISSRLGSIDQRDSMLRIVTELLKFTDGVALRPIVPQIVGVLLRLLAEHCPTLVKYHAVQVVEVLLEKSPDVMRNFAPQLVTFLQRIINEAQTEPTIPETESLLTIANAASETVKTWIRERNS